MPVTAASVSTRVVSWNDAAEMNDSVDSDALVIPSNTRVYLATNLSSAARRSFSPSTAVSSIWSPLMKLESPDSATSTLRSI
ncbi:hypothetical protein D3C72_2099560 [compost metagenome]